MLSKLTQTRLTPKKLQVSMFFKLNSKIYSFLLSGLFLSFVMMASSCNAEIGPAEQIKISVDEVIAILKNDDKELRWVEKKEKIVTIVKSRFDSKELAQRVLAKHWRKRSIEEKEQFVILFAQVLENTYIDRLKSYSDEQIDFIRQVIKGEKGLVYAKINYNQQDIPILYRVKKNNGEWFIYDIIIEGVSLVQNYRKQFAQIIKREKYSGLVERMEEKIRQHREKDISKDEE